VRGRGEIRLQLLEREAPRAVGEFVRLARAGAFDGRPFRLAGVEALEEGLPPPAGGSTERGKAGPPAEIGPAPFTRGSVGLAGPAEGGGFRLFLAHRPLPELDGRLALFARVVQGMEAADRIDDGDVIERVTIEGWPE
jgi:peptidyl-prolyl cis-trans isomerase B (cyclophilin B)